MSLTAPFPRVSPADFDRAATRLLSAVLAAENRAAPFPTRIEGALAAALRLFDDHPELARILTAPSRPEEPELEERRSTWATTFADLLRDAAQNAPEAHPPPPFLEPYLIAGVAWRVGSNLRATGQTTRSILPSLLEFLLLYYLDPPQVHPIVAACSRRTLGKRGLV